MDPELIARLNANLESLITVIAEGGQLPTPRSSVGAVQAMIERNQAHAEAQALASRQTAQRYALVTRQRAERVAAAAQKRAEREAEATRKRAERAADAAQERAERPQRLEGRKHWAALTGDPSAGMAKLEEKEFVENLKRQKEGKSGEPGILRSLFHTVGSFITGRPMPKDVAQSQRGQGLWRALGETESAMTSTSGVESTGHAFGALGQVGGAVGGKAGLALKVAGTFGEILFKSIGLLDKWNNQLRAGDLRLAEYSGQMAQVMAETEVWQVQYFRQRGDAASESARSREAAYRAFKDEVAPIEDIWANFRNGMAAGLLRFGQEAIAPLARTIQWLQGRDDIAQQRGDISMGGIFANIGAHHWMETYGQPMRFNNGWYQQGDIRPPKPN